jgi:acyl-CoA dehydrogenase
MDFEVSEKMNTILELVGGFVERELVPIEQEMLHGDPARVDEMVAHAQDKVRQMELWAPNHPVEFGGLGLSMVEHGLLSEALGRSPLGHLVFGVQAPDAGNVEILHQHATPEQREQWLRPLVEGAIRSCFSMTEPETAGSNPLLLETTAVRDGDDYVINGQKWFTSSADGAAFAIVMAVTDPDAPPYQRTSMIIVPTDTPGFNLVRNVSVMGHAGSGHASHAEVIYQSCRVPQANLLGPEGAGFAIAQERLGPGRIHHCMRLIGQAERSLEAMCRRASARVAFGRPVADRTVTQERIADARIMIDQARLLVLNAAWKMDVAGNKAAKKEIAMIKVAAPTMACQVIDWAMQAHGAAGLCDDFQLAFFYAQARTLRFADGPDEVHRNQIARLELAAYRPPRS